MQIRKLLINLLFTLLLYSAPIFAEKKHSVLNLLHINGINTTKEQAQDNRDALEKAANLQYQFVAWNYLYNETQGIITSDLLDVLRQKNQEKAQLDINDFVDVYMERHNLHYEPYSEGYEKLKEKLRTLYLRDMNYSSNNSEDLLNQYHEKVVEGAKSLMTYLNATDDNKHHIVLFVPHSQGALYANSLTDFLIKAEHFPPRLIGIYAFATPAAIFGSDEAWVYSNYTTGYNDFVIKMLDAFAAVVPGTDRPFESNFHLNICNDKFCHGLITSYLANSDVIRKFSLEVNSLAKYLIT